MVNTASKKLIGLVLAHNLVIISGKKLVDSKGAFTCFTNRGASTIDGGVKEDL